VETSKLNLGGIEGIDTNEAAVADLLALVHVPGPVVGKRLNGVVLAGAKATSGFRGSSAMVVNWVICRSAFRLVQVGVILSGRPDSGL